MPAVSFQAISKTFATPKGPFQALNQVNLDIEEGEFFGLLGPNGCGKSTTLKIVLGLVPAMPQLLILPASALAFAIGWQLRRAEAAVADLPDEIRVQAEGLQTLYSVNTPDGARVARGVALCKSFGSPVAMVMEVSLSPSGTPRT